jgi:hypothetical protein
LAGLFDQAEGHAVVGGGEQPDCDVSERGILKLAQDRCEAGGGLLAEVAFEVRRDADQRDI